MVVDVSLWPSRPVAATKLFELKLLSYYCVEILVYRGHATSLRPPLVDEACDVAKTLTSLNANSALLVLFPIPHTACEKHTCVANRRYIEDRLMKSLSSL